MHQVALNLAGNKTVTTWTHQQGQWCLTDFPAFSFSISGIPFRNSYKNHGSIWSELMITIEISKDTFETKHGVNLFLYDSDSVETKFGTFGLIEAKEINEPAKNTGNKPIRRFLQIICRKITE